MFAVFYNIPKFFELTTESRSFVHQVNTTEQTDFVKDIDLENNQTTTMDIIKNETFEVKIQATKLNIYSKNCSI